MYQRIDTGFVTDMRKSSMKPVEPDYHYSSIDDDDIRRHRKPEYHKLDKSIPIGMRTCCHVLRRFMLTGFIPA